jgi:hypothetical protein
MFWVITDFIPNHLNLSLDTSYAISRGEQKYGSSCGAPTVTKLPPTHQYGGAPTVGGSPPVHQYGCAPAVRGASPTPLYSGAPVVNSTEVPKMECAGGNPCGYRPFPSSGFNGRGQHDEKRHACSTRTR